MSMLISRALKTFLICYKGISLDPERGLEPTPWLLTENADYQVTALPSELSSFD